MDTAAELKVTALRPMQADGRQYHPGDEIPGALKWRALRRLTETGWVAVVPRGAKAALDEYSVDEMIAHLEARGYKVARPRTGKAAKGDEPQGS
ncbi:MAG: hypothetical protein KGL39_17520 [Patescibacteria group bacterium]|nr:hypothetical protein [Patescibacteria group bacterium]